MSRPEPRLLTPSSPSEQAEVSFAGTVVVVNYNGGTLLARCLRSILEFAPGARVVVVDNASTDGSDDVAAAFGKTVRLVRNERNGGFAAAVNLGVALTGHDDEFVMFLNPDSWLLPGAADHLAAVLTEHPDCAIAAPTMFDERGRPERNLRGDPTLLTGLFGRSSLFTRLFPRSSLARRNVRTDLAKNEAGALVDWVSGACMMVRRAAFQEMGGFDERFFLYWEDADLCRRLRELGHTIRYAPAAQVGHRAGTCSESAKVLSVRAFHRSVYIYYARHVARTPALRGFAWVLLELRSVLMIARVFRRRRRVADRVEAADVSAVSFRAPAD
jgi:N-acetylglucosaminyl-diphospho-decaprenol L-rhamnosyltransferase